jgi:ring-1,2-phenylacetyl-CoA epoxidase subunit PaaB
MSGRVVEASAVNTPAVKGNSATGGSSERSWPLWEVFIRGKRGLAHVHVGSLHAPDAEMALRNGRDVYTRRKEGVSLWVVRSSDIVASSPNERDSFFDPAADKIYRHPTFYDVPEDVEYL